MSAAVRHPAHPPHVLSSGPSAPGLALALVLMLGLMASPARATEPTQAELAFQRGRALLAEKRIAEACPQFERSHRLEPALGTLLNLADCSEQQGRLAKAFRAFTDAARWAREKNESRREEVATQRAEALRGRLAFLLFEVQAQEAKDTKDAKDAVDASDATVELRSLPEQTVEFTFALQGAEPLAVDPGAYEVRVTAPRAKPYLRRLDVSRAGPVRVLVQLEPAASSPSPSAPNPVPVAAPDSPPSPAKPPPPSSASSASSTPSPPLSGASASPKVEAAPLHPLAPAGLVAGGALAVAGLVGIIYSQTVMTRVDRQQPGGPDAENPTVSRAEYETARVLYPLAISSAALGAAGLVAATLIRAPDKAGVVTLIGPIPVQSGVLAAVQGTF